MAATMPARKRPRQPAAPRVMQRPPSCAECPEINAPFGMPDGRRLCFDCWTIEPSTQAARFKSMREAAGDIGD